MKVYSVYWLLKELLKDSSYGECLENPTQKYQKEFLRRFIKVMILCSGNLNLLKNVTMSIGHN